MKTQIVQLLKAMSLLTLLLFCNMSKAQNSFIISVENLKQTAANKLEFDVYLLNTDNNPFELGSCQLGFTFNSSFYSGGTISATIDNSNSGLNSLQKFNTIPNTSSADLIKLVGVNPPGAGSGTIISQNSPGTLLTHFVISGSVNFLPNSVSGLSFCSGIGNASSYPTRVSQYIGIVNTPLPVVSGINAVVKADADAIAFINPNRTNKYESAVNSTDVQDDVESIRQVMVNCYPNPFNNKTYIKFMVPENSNVKLIVYDLAGNQVKTLFDEDAIKNQRYEVEFDGETLSPGIYFYRLSSTDEIYTGKVMLLGD